VETPSNRDLRDRQIARELLINPEQSYTDIVKKTGIKSNFPRQALYSRLRSERFKLIMAEETKKILSAEEVKQKITAKTDSENENIALKALELMGRTHALFVDKTINENHDYNESELEIMRKKALEEAVEALSSAESVLAGKTETEPSAKIEPKTEAEAKEG
jgi:uncharacterized membrane protein YfhO